MSAFFVVGALVSVVECPESGHDVVSHGGPPPMLHMCILHQICVVFVECLCRGS
jgi:hypothetical protein